MADGGQRKQNEITVTVFSFEQWGSILLKCLNLTDQGGGLKNSNIQMMI